MRRLVKKIHTYAGLVSFTAFIVYGIAGVRATFSIAQPARPAGVREVEFVAPDGMTDEELADHVGRTLDLPLTGEPYGVRRDAAQHLQMTFYTPNGPRRVTVLENEHLVRIASDHPRLLSFLSNLHSTTTGNAAPRFLTRAWAWYNEIAIWSLILMSVSGMYLWLASRPGHRLAQISFAAGSGAFVVLYWMTR